MLELYDRGRLMNILPCLVGDLTDAVKQKAQTRIMQKLGINMVGLQMSCRHGTCPLYCPARYTDGVAGLAVG